MRIKYFYLSAYPARKKQKILALHRHKLLSLQHNNRTLMTKTATIHDFEQELISNAHPEKIAILSSFFKTAPGEYGEGDRFIGLTVPENRVIARRYTYLSCDELTTLLRNPIHEIRLAALLCLIAKYKSRHTDEAQRQSIFNTYINNTAYINNWDLVDLSAPQIVGEHLLHTDRSLLYRFARNGSLWEQRIAIVATYTYIRNNDFDDTLAIADILRTHPHDLIQKAVGWMLREVGKRDKQVLIDYLQPRYATLPRTLLRYAIEKFTPDERKHYMQRNIF